MTHLGQPGACWYRRAAGWARDADSAPYIAMQFVEGLPLDQWCASAAPDLRTPVRVLREIAEAIAYAHARLVVHRDLKPSDVIIDGFGRARLLDFGIAASAGRGHLDRRCAATDGLAPCRARPDRCVECSSRPVA